MACLYHHFGIYRNIYRSGVFFIIVILAKVHCYLPFIILCCFAAEFFFTIELQPKEIIHIHAFA